MEGQLPRFLPPRSPEALSWEGHLDLLGVLLVPQVR